MQKDDPTADELELVQPLLPRGRHRLTPEEVAENQRQRLIAALAQSVAARGYAATSVDRILQGSGVSRGTFYELFANRHECLLAAHGDTVESLTACVTGACAVETRWAAKVRAAIYAAVDFAVRFPDRTRLLTLDVFAADDSASRRGLLMVDRFAAMLRSGREHHPKAATLPEVTERAMIGSISMTINWRLLRGESLAGLEPQLAYLALVPYLGPAAAQCEVS